MRTRLTLLAIWGCFLARAMFYCAAIPLWEGYDEYSHFALIQYVSAHHGAFPLGGTLPNSSRRLTESRRLTPGAWVIHEELTGILSYEEHFALPPAEQKARRGRIESLPVAWSRQEASPAEPVYEAQQPPLYYWLLAPFGRLAESWSIPAIVLLLRSLTVLLASAAVPLTFYAGRRVFRNHALALGAALVVASFPELLILTARVSNEGLSVALGSLFVLASLCLLEEKPSRGAGARFGLVMGAALLTKAYFLALLPAATLVLIYAWRFHVPARTRAISQAIAAFGTCFVVSGWWYARNLLVSGTLTGQFEDAQAAANHSVSLAETVRAAHWGKVFDFILTSHIWLGDWSFLVARTWMYRVVEAMLLAAAAGLCLQAFRTSRGLPSRPQMAVLALPYAAMTLGLCFHAAQVFRARGEAATVGYYLYALVLPEAVLILAGIASLLPAKQPLLAVPIVAFVLIGLEQFGLWFLQLPYYAGLIQHGANGRLPAAHFGQWAGLFDRLSSIGPVSSSPMLAAMAGFYAIASLALLWLALRLSRPAAISS